MSGMIAAQYYADTRIQIGQEIKRTDDLLAEALYYWVRIVLSIGPNMQATVALSSAEAELYAGVMTASETIGLRALAKDLGMDLTVTVAMDATSAMAIMQKEGLSTAKHIEVQCVWAQDQLRKQARAHEGRNEREHR